jgi:DNA-binding response OmpR family regulator
MPELNGLDFARSMDRMQPEVPVILVSGRKQAMEVARGVEIIRKVIIKPYNKGIISRALRQVLDAASEDAGSETGQKSGVAEHG